MENKYFKEETFEGKINKRLLVRLAGLVKSDYFLLGSFLFFIILTSVLESFDTYILKIVVDEGIIGLNKDALFNNLMLYGIVLVLLSGTVFGFIYSAWIVAR